MNDTQVRAMRNLWEEVTSKPVTMTAREMALIPHKLERAATIAKTTDGRKFAWIESTQLWHKYN